MDNHMRKDEKSGGLGWSGSWHMGWITWWLGGGCCGMKWSENFILKPLDPARKVDLTDWEDTPNPEDFDAIIEAEDEARNKATTPSASGDVVGKFDERSARKLARRKSGEGLASPMVGIKKKPIGRIKSIRLAGAVQSEIERKMEERIARMEQLLAHQDNGDTDPSSLHGIPRCIFLIKRRLGLGENHSVFLLAIRSICGCTITVDRAPEPADVVWGNLHTASITRFLALVFSVCVLLLFGALVSSTSFLYIWWKSQQFLHPEKPIYERYGTTMLYVISYGNLILKVRACSFV